MSWGYLGSTPLASELFEFVAPEEGSNALSATVHGGFVQASVSGDSVSATVHGGFEIQVDGEGQGYFVSSYTLWEGTTVRLLTDKPFTSITNVIVNPDVVTLTYSVQNQTDVVRTWTNGASPPDPTFTIVNDSTGYFHADFSTAGQPGTWVVEWNGQPGVSALDTTHTSAIWVYEIIVSPTGLQAIRFFSLVRRYIEGSWR